MNVYLKPREREMGCDIHMAVERRVGGAWRRVEPDGGVFDERRYTLFSVLADVRNGHGFAGVSTGEVVRPIAKPRGLPRDLSREVRRMASDDWSEDEGWLGDHSHSWLLLSEVLAYDWDQGRTVAGTVPLKDFARRVEERGPKIPLVTGEYPYQEWSGSISGRGIVTIEALDAVQQLAHHGIAERPGWERPDRFEVYVRDLWVMPLREQVGTFLTEFVPALQKLDPDPTNVRLVFGFDS